MKTIAELRTELTAKRKALKAIFDESGEGWDLSKVKSVEGGVEGVAAEIKRRQVEINDLKDKLDSAVDIAKIAKQNAEAITDASTAVEPPPHPTGEGTKGAKGQVGTKSLGKLFVESKAFKELVGGQGPSALLNFDSEQLKTLFQTAVGWPPESVREGRVELSAQQPPIAIDFFPPARPIKTLSSTWKRPCTRAELLRSPKVEPTERPP